MVEGSGDSITEVGFDDTRRKNGTSQAVRMANREEDLDAIEAAIEHRLHSWDSGPEALPESSKQRQPPVKCKRKRAVGRKARNGPGQQSSRTQLLEEAVSAKASAVESAVALLMVQPQPSAITAAQSTADVQVVRNGEHKSAPEYSNDSRVTSCGSKGEKRDQYIRSTSQVEHQSATAYVEQHRREVGELGASALSKRNKKEYEARKRLEQGCKVLKQQKMPLPMLLGVRKKQRQRDLKAKELALASGMLIRSKRRNK